MQLIDNHVLFNKYKTFSVLIYSYINTSGNWENEKLCDFGTKKLEQSIWNKEKLEQSIWNKEKFEKLEQSIVCRRYDNKLSNLFESIHPR